MLYLNDITLRGKADPLLHLKLVVREDRELGLHLNGRVLVIAEASGGDEKWGGKIKACPN